MIIKRYSFELFIGCFVLYDCTICTFLYMSWNLSKTIQEVIWVLHDDEDSVNESLDLVVRY